jgi:hypothetical protein
MKYRQIRVIATGQWVEALFTVQAKPGEPDIFSVALESHQADIAKALGVAPAELEVVDADRDLRSGVLLPLPRTAPPPDPTAPRRQRVAELIAIPRSDWTAAQQRELLQLTAQATHPELVEGTT